MNRKCIGIDIGGMSIKAGLVDACGNITAKETVPTPIGDKTALCEAIFKLIENVLKKGEKTEITLRLGAEAFALWDEDGNFSVKKGGCELYIGEYQPDIRSFELTGKKPYVIKLFADMDINIDSVV